MKLRQYQTETCAAVWAFLCAQAGNPVAVLPTGAGKSLVIAELCRAAVEQFRGRVIVLAHRKELIEQNADKLRALGIHCGAYSAGLRLRHTDADVIVGGIQSVFRRPEEFGARHLVIVDEAHLVPHDGEGMYRQFIGKLREINPKLRMVGLTATPYRTSEGSLCRADGLFQGVCYEAKIPELIAGGFLSPLTNRPAAGSLDTSKLHIRGGEFIPGEVEALFGGKVTEACQEIADATRGRRSVLVFCAGVAHCYHVAACLETILGEPVRTVTGETPPLERSGVLSQFRAGSLRILCNVDVLTTGFDAPGIDAIAILRATLSPGLFSQMCGRGFRRAEGKADCLILDFGENLKRHGPLDAIDFGKRKNPAQPGDAPEKQCPNCSTGVHASAAECPECGFRFPARKPNHKEGSDSESQILSAPQGWIVEEVRFSRHRKKKAEPDAPDTLRVDYYCQPSAGGMSETISEWVCLEHEGWVQRKARRWWTDRTLAPVGNIAAALDLWARGAFAAPSRLMARKEGRFWKIVSCELDPKPEAWSDVAAPDPFEVEEAPF